MAFTHVQHSRPIVQTVYIHVLAVHEEILLATIIDLVVVEIILTIIILDLLLAEVIIVEAASALVEVAHVTIAADQLVVVAVVYVEDNGLKHKKNEIN